MNIRAKIYGGEAVEPELLGAKKPRGAKADELNSVAVPREEKRQSNSRYGDRHRLLDEKIRLTHKGKTHKLELINLSGGGAMVSGFKPMLWVKDDLHHRNAKIRVRVRNISSTGAMIESSEPVLVGGQAILELGDEGFTPATIAWMIGDQIGLAFRSTFDMAQLARSTPEVAPQKW